MQRTFIQYAFIIISCAIFLILFTNFVLTMYTLESQQFNTFYNKSEQVIHTLENNQMELSILQENLDEDYLTRARAAAYIFDTQEEVTMDVSQMQYLAELLNVDELHVIDENGIIVSASISKYVGFDMGAYKQSSEFLPLLESNDENAYLIQDTQPNAADHKIMKYVGVVRKGVKGIVQVGFKPTRQMAAESRNTYEYIFSRFPTDSAEELFVADRNTGAILGHSNGLAKNFTEECYQLNELLKCKKGDYKKGENGQLMYVVSREYNDVLICAAIPISSMLNRLLNQVFSTMFYLLIIEAIVILLLNYLVKRKVVDDIHKIICYLSNITNGNLDTEVNVRGNQELEALSNGINTMVRSIINISDRISTIIKISGIPLAAFEYDDNIQHVFVTSGLKDILDIPDSEAEEIYQNSKLFDNYIKNIISNPLNGETDIYQISDAKYVRIHMSESNELYLGVVTDVTEDIIKKRQMQYENTHDSLTGLNKFSHFKYLASEILGNMNKENICAVVMLDLDYFKSINDTYGHDMGDKYLQSFSAVMKSMPSNHVLSARRSGDEFCLLIFNCLNKAEIIKYLDLFFATLKNNIIKLSDENSKTISASGGFVCTYKSDTSIEQLLSQADEALYKVKKDTKGHYGEYLPE